MKSFLSILYPALAWTVLILLDQFLELQLMHPLKWMVLGLIALLYVISSRVLKRGFDDIELFQKLFMGTLMLRMFLTLCVAGWYLYDGVEAPAKFVLLVFGMYFSFLIVSVAYSSKQLQKMKSEVESDL